MRFHNYLNIRFRKIDLFNAFVTLLVLALLMFALTHMNSLEEVIDKQVVYYGATGLFVMAFLLDFLPQFFSPVVPLATGILLGINTPLAILSAVLGSALGSMLSYYLGKRHMVRVIDAILERKEFNKFTSFINQYGKWALLFGAISPLPYVPIVFGALNFSKKNFIFYGLIPRAIGFIVFGYITALF